MICKATLMTTLLIGHLGASATNVIAAIGNTTTVNMTNTEALKQVVREGCAMRNDQLASTSVGMRKLARSPMTPKNTNTRGKARTPSKGRSTTKVPRTAMVRTLAIDTATAMPK